MYREIIDSWEGGDREEERDRIDHGLRAILFEIVRVLNYARLKIDISFWPRSILPFYGIVSTAEKMDRFFYGVGEEGQASGKNFYQQFRTVSSVSFWGGIMFDPPIERSRGASRGHVNGLVSFSSQGKWPTSFRIIDGDAWNAIRHAP